METHQISLEDLEVRIENLQTVLEIIQYELEQLLAMKEKLTITKRIGFTHNENKKCQKSQ